MNKKLREKIEESVSSVVPITAIVLALTVVLVPMETGTVLLFLTGAVLLILGMGLFQLGAEMAMTPLGEGIGTQLFRIRHLPVTLGLCLVMGALITIAEPDLQVLANQVPSLPNATLIWTVALGVGVFLALAAVRILFGIPLQRMLWVLYGLLFSLSLAAPGDFLSVAFASGGVTTGPMTVPFIMALGVGLSATRSDKNGADDSFGLVAFSSVGPILMVLLLGIFQNPGEASYTTVDIPHLTTTQEVVRAFARELPHYGREVLSSVAPVLGVFVVFQVLTRRYHRRQLMKMVVGFVYTIVGLVLFLTGVNVGFAPVGALLGQDLVSLSSPWALVPVGMLIGYYIVKAEPAVQLLNHQVEDLTNGAVSRHAMNLCLSVGVSVSVGLAMVRVVTGLHLYWILIPGYLLALVLTRFVPQVFVGIAFDSGGVASGPMTSTFLLPLSIGACAGVGGNVVTDAFGVVALVALAPLIAVQVMGVVYARRLRLAPEELTQTAARPEDDEIVEWEEE